MTPFKTIFCALLLTLSPMVVAGPFSELTDKQLVEFLVQDFQVVPMNGAVCIVPNNKDKIAQHNKNTGAPLYQCFKLPNANPPGWYGKNDPLPHEDGA